jgi:hypothetical protein
VSLDRASAPTAPSARLVLFVLLALPLALFYPALLGGKMLWGADIETLELVFKTSAQRSLHAGEWPLWMPEILCGMPGIASSNLIFLHPLELAFCLLNLPPWMAFGLDTAAEVAACAAGGYLLLRLLGLSRGASLLGALSFAASGTQISLLYAGHINNTKGIAMIPWVFWGALKGWREKSHAAWGFCGTALALQVLGMGLQIFAYTLIALAAWVAWLAWSDGGPGVPAAGRGFHRAAKGLALAALVAFLLSAPQLLPSLQYKPYSWRESFSYESFTSWSFNPKESLTWIVPGFWGWRSGAASWDWPAGAAPAYRGSWPFCFTTEYFGLLPWMLAFAGAAVLTLRTGWRTRLRRPEAFFLLLAAFSFLSGIGKYFPLHLLYYHLPVYSGFRTWTRFLCLMTFSVSVLAAYGWDALMDGDPTPWTAARRAALAFVILALLCSAAALGAAQSSVASSAAGLIRQLGAQAPADALELARSSALRSLLLSLVLLAGLFYWKRLRQAGLAIFLAALAFHAFDVSEVSRRYLEFKAPAEVLQRPAWLSVLPDGQQGDPFRILDLPGLWRQNSGALFGYETVQGYHGVEMSAPIKLLQALQSRQMDWANLMGARYVLSPRPLGVVGFRPLYSGGPYIYENPAALPRAFVLGRSQAVADDDEAWKALAQPGFDVLRSVTLDKDAGLDGLPPQAQVRWLDRGRNHITVQADSARRGLLVVSQTWYPSWEAWVDGQKTELLKADGGAMQAIMLDAGSHRVELAYSPRLLQFGGLLAALGLALMALLLRQGGKAAATPLSLKNHA